jgi:hypothetical protein
MANAAVVGGSIRFPSLQSIGNLFRFGINDSFNSTTGAGTGQGNAQGLIMSNLNPDLVTLMDEAIQELYSDLRNVGDAELIIDNYIVGPLPPLANPNPAVQVALGFAGYFDGFEWHPQFKLPISLSKMLFMWERQAGGNRKFIPMRKAPFALGGVMQGERMHQWEQREDLIFMPGCLEPTELRLRARITYPELLFSSGLNFQTTYVPIVDSKQAIVSKMRIQYALRFAPDKYQTAIAEEIRQMNKLRLEVVRAQQDAENERASFGEESTQDMAISYSWL